MREMDTIVDPGGSGPVFVTQRLRFDLWKAEDFLHLYALHSDKRIQGGYSAGPEAWTPEGILARINGYIEEQQRFGITKWKMSLRNGTFIGRGGWSPWAEGTVEIGYAVKTEHQGKGYAQEAANGLVRWANENRLERLIGFALTDNVSSRRILERCGMQYDGIKAVNSVPNVFYALER